ncbi:hypothetical protein BpHYR1_030397 [Brachionus plicatilis]|uniref:Uncharacterized protein n=1 Tax=Brachionus plicatilis TaxID=10195 RepID=A0A3M7T275_BRAPC|nr:hypothetical protein BpHYR1_030397 [Brachionus plicatilis]RNA42123.1 hypothetical protein BpHYR1_030397 [Brachionus plicatilis]
MESNMPQTSKSSQSEESKSDLNIKMVTSELRNIENKLSKKTKKGNLN